MDTWALLLARPDPALLVLGKARVDLTGAQLESSWDPDHSGSHGCQKHFLLYEEERLGRCWSDACWPRR
ncbi:hypothetical protein Y1Q_0005399 [Alligator mississippiensis]|uniref:Uncharacterized protein n=1 Tax=Alligator mississippiensis TaxID=8496 RepID=A0A151NCP7_ALLMI|nr:hypothetical protein Y1Q_0005399 [Alligator mississippiensis]